MAAASSQGAMSMTEQEVTESLLASFLPNKAPEKISKWCQYLHSQECDTMQTLADLSDAGWASLDLPIAVKDTLRARVCPSPTASPQPAISPQPTATPQSALTTFPASVTPQQPEQPLLTQLDCIVMDISSSMKAKSAIDPLKTREDMSKLLFHTMVDKLVSLELSHAVGLISFGQHVHPINITREYERFHDELGRLDARENSTALYDAVYEAAKFLDKYATEHKAQLRPASHTECKDGRPGCVRRIFVLTDGDDNASKRKPWEVAKHLQERGIILDVIPLAGENQVLQAMASATSGYCLKVTSEQQGCALFERQAILCVADRERGPLPLTITSIHSLEQLMHKSKALEMVPTVVAPRAVFAPTISATQVDATVQSSAIFKQKGGNVSGAMKRALKEYKEIQRSPDPVKALGCEVFISKDDFLFWKMVIAGPEGTPYAGFYFLLSVSFPAEYPFKAPKIQFVTPIFHPNVNADGRICLDEIQRAWNPAVTVDKAARSILTMLQMPNTDDALDDFKAQLYMQERARYVAEASTHTEKHAFASLEALKAEFGIQ
eukprot:g59948.t1